MVMPNDMQVVIISPVIPDVSTEDETKTEHAPAIIVTQRHGRNTDHISFQR